MRVLAIQLKRIGDLALTVPALALLRRERPDAHLTLAVQESTAGLLPAVPSIDGGIVFGARRGWTPWQQTLTGGFDVVLDFTGSDRAALVAGLSRAERRLTFRRRDPRRLRTAAFNELIDSSVRDLHTIDHYCDLVRPLLAAGGDPASPAPAAGLALLRLPPGSREQAERLRQSAGIRGPYALVHPGTARGEKYWEAERWARVIAHCQSRGLPCLLTGGGDLHEKSHLAAIESGLSSHAPNFAGELDLVMLTALAAEARLVLSVDTAAAHLAAAFQRPQIVLYGPTNPFHWRPRHAHVIILSAASAGGPAASFQPRLPRAAMDLISTEAVIRATDSLLSQRL